MADDAAAGVYVEAGLYSQLATAMDAGVSDYLHAGSTGYEPKLGTATYLQISLMSTEEDGTLSKIFCGYNRKLPLPLTMTKLMMMVFESCSVRRGRPRVSRARI